MSVINALFSTAFLILVAVSAAVTGSMVVLALFDCAFRKEKSPGAGGESLPDQGREDLDQGNEDEADDNSLARIHMGIVEDHVCGSSMPWPHGPPDRLRLRRIRLRTRTLEPA